MFRTVFAFEVRHWLRSPVLWVLTALMALLTFGAVASDNVNIGQSFDNLLKNAPYVVEAYYAYMSAIGLLIVTAFVQASALRDVNHRSQELIYTTPLKKTPYLLGRFFGAFAVSLIPQLGVGVGILLGAAAPWVDPERVGPTAWHAHLNGFLAFSIPNTFIIAAIIFAIAALTRKTAATFVGAIAILVGYSVAGTLLQDLEGEDSGMLADTFAIGTYENLTKYWTVAERNSESLALVGDLLLNRLLWMAVGAGILTFGVAAFRFTVEDGLLERTTRKVKGGLARLLPGSRSGGGTGAGQAGSPEAGQGPVLPDAAPIPTAAVSTGLVAQLGQMWSQARVDMAGVFRSVPFRVILLFALFNVGFSLAESEQFYGLTTWPVTYQLASIIRGSMYLFTFLVLVLYSGELVWKERTARMDQIHDALPHPVWTTALGKLLALLGVVFSLQLLAMGLGIATQLLKGYTDFDVTVWVRELLVLDMVTFGFMAVLALVVQAVVNNRYLGYFVVVALLLLNTFVWGPLKVQSLMLRYGATPGYVYSDMAGYGPWAGSLAWFTAYWIPVAALLVLLAILVWIRGVDTSLAVRRLNVGLRFRGGARAAFAGFVVTFVIVGGWVFYNTQLLNAYPATRTVEEAAVAYETRYKEGWEDARQPRVTDLFYDIDIRPGDRDLYARGRAVVTNPWGEPIDTLMVNLSRQVEFELEVPGATLARTDEETSVAFYALEPALPPGDSVVMAWTAEYVTEGFENQVRVTQVVENGTFFNNGFITPSFGYDPGREMSSRNDRRKYGLPPRERMPALVENCTDACMSTYITDDADWVTMETVITTDADQVAVAPGSLVEETVDEAAGRRTFRYVLDHPSLAFNSFISARYQVAREEWEGVDVEVYHHPDHTYNVEKMLRSIRRSLAYNQENFGPYRHGQARIIEFPRYASFAQAFPGTMPYSESLGFIARIEDEEDIDMVFYVTAHEMAHQWWAHQVIGAAMEGATVLSETLAQYSAIMTMEREYGEDAIYRFLRYEMDRYLRSRGGETLKEKPLMRVDASQGYVHYRKGSVVLYYLKEMLGEDVLNAALRALVEDYAYAGPPYPTSHDLVDRIRAVTPDSLQYLVTDAFERIILFDNRVVGDPEVEETADGRWEVTYQVETTKLEADSLGAETEVPMDDYVDLAVLGEPGEGEDRGPVLARERRRLNAGTHEVTFTVDERPWQVAVDPDFFLIDRIPDDNLKRVSTGG